MKLCSFLYYCLHPLAYLKRFIWGRKSLTCINTLRSWLSALLIVILLILILLLVLIVFNNTEFGPPV